MKDLHVSWDEYHRLIEGLAAQIHASGWQFDAVVCLARGGLRVGDILSRIFERPLGVLFTSSYREDAGTVRSTLHIGAQLSSAQTLPGPNWLLVDDLVDSGATITEVLPVLMTRHPQVREIRSAVLWQKACSRATPDYRMQYLPTDPWIHQPFEIYDRMRPQSLARISE